MILSVPAILKYNQLINHNQDTYKKVSEFQACVFIDKLGLQKSKLLPQPCKNYAKFLQIESVYKTQQFLDMAPLYSLIFMFVTFAIVLQNRKGNKDGL